MKSKIEHAAIARNYDDPRLTAEMRQYGCYTMVVNEETGETKIALTPEFIQATKGFVIKSDVGFGVERINQWDRDANGQLVLRPYPDRLEYDIQPGVGKYTARITLTCECGREITLTPEQGRLFIRGALENRYYAKVLLRCPQCNKMLFKP